ncbi:MAG TPA: hypothetical protein VE673_16110 [Pseudonocardiaceae bacterium]|nr:hypothetical protein [Pseudonocardiaceae bacterium]
MYAPLALWDVLLPVIGGRLKITPSYPGTLGGASIPLVQPDRLVRRAQAALMPPVGTG